MPIYYINLASRTDRRDFMEEQFARLGLEATRIEAVTPADIPAEDIARYSDNTRPTFRKPNQLGCSMSHQKAWSAMLDAGDERAVIMEDDALLSASLPDFLADLDEVSFDLLRFERSSRKVRMLPAVYHVDPSVALRPFRSTLGGSSGYILSARAARKLLDHPAMRTLAVDKFLYNCMDEPGKGLVRYHTDPALCVQYHNVSSDGRAGGVGWSDLNSVKVVHVFAQKHPVQHFFRRAVSSIGTGARNVIDHLIHLPKGITKERIAFRPD